jgi:hypothetical protein
MLQEVGECSCASGGRSNGACRVRIGYLKAHLDENVSLQNGMYAYMQYTLLIFMRNAGR